MMELQHFGLRHPPLGKESTELWDDGMLARLHERFQWLLQSPGVGLLTGEAGVGKTAALRALRAASSSSRRWRSARLRAMSSRARAMSRTSSATSRRGTISPARARASSLSCFHSR